MSFRYSSSHSLNSSDAWIHTLAVMEAHGTRATTVPVVFQCLFQCILDISNASKGQYTNSNPFWINCYNIVKFGTNCLLLCIFLDYLDIIWFEFMCVLCSIICIELQVYFLGYDCFLDDKCWFMIYVWVYVDLFELIWNLNELREINKICVDVFCCLVLSLWVIIYLELISWLK
jgi:hypothetical protein